MGDQHESTPPSDQSVTLWLGQLQQIDRLSDEFERAWKAGRTPRIEDYLDRAPDVGR